MRSRRPKVLHQPLRPPPDRLSGQCRPGARQPAWSSWWAGRRTRCGRRWRRRPRPASSSRRSAGAPATPCSRRASPVATVAGTLLVLPGDMPLLSETHAARLVDHHRADGRRGHPAHRRARRIPPAMAACCARAAGRSRIVEHRDATPAQREIREIGTSVYCFDARALLARAGPGHARERAGRVLPHRRDRASSAAQGAAARGGDRRRSARVPRRQRPEAARRSSPPSCGGASWTASWPTASPCSTPPRTYVDDTVTIGADTVLYPGVIARGRAPRSAPSAWSAPAPTWPPAASATGCRSSPTACSTESVVEDDAPARALLPPAPAEPRGREGQDRQLRGAEEVADRPRRQGAASLLRGRRHVGEGVNIGAGTITCNYDGVDQARDRDRRRAPSSAPTRAWWRRSPSARAPTWRRAR